MHQIAVRAGLEPGKVLGVAFVDEPVYFACAALVTIDGDAGKLGHDRNVWVPTRPGFATMHAYEKHYRIAVFPAEALSHRALARLHPHDPDHIVGGERDEAARRLILLAVARDPGVELHVLTDAKPIPNVDLRLFGA